MKQALVVGGGPAGAALAIKLARAGKSVVLLERDPGPAHKVCGEFLSREAGVYLASFGLDLPTLGAVAIDTLRFCEGAHVSEVALPFVACGLSRFVLDDALLCSAESSGADVRRGSKVVELGREGAGWRARLTDGAFVDADEAFLATGKHDVRGLKRPPGLQGDLVAFKLHWRLAAAQTYALTAAIELFTFEGGYAGLSLVEDRVANLCLVVRRSRLAALGHRWETLLAAIVTESPPLGGRLAGAVALWPKPLALSFIPYGHVRRHADGLWRLGDQAAVIPSFSGDGMSIALHSAELAASAFLRGDDAEGYQRALARDVKTQMLLATGLSHGLVHKASQLAFGAAARAWPALLTKVAFRTRIADAALARAAASA